MIRFFQLIKRHRLFFIILLSGLLLGCSALTNPPRLTKTRVPPTAGAADVPFFPAPTPTGDPLLADGADGGAGDRQINPVLTVWVNETSDAHRQALAQMTAVLDAEYGLHMEIVLVDEDRLADLVDGAAATGQLPDVIIHPIEYTAGWAARGVLDPDLSQGVIESLGVETFDPDALRSVGVNGQSAAVPINGYKQILIYRKDWFDSLRLNPPDDFRAILSGAEAIYRSETLSAQTGISSTLLSGLVVPTESDLITTHQVFEHFANANGCRLVDESGEVLIDSPACVETFEFYRELVNGYSPNDIQTDTSAINAYLSGRTGMIFGSPEFLVDIAGLSAERQPSCPECSAELGYLTTNSAVQAGFSGVSGSAGAVDYGHISLMGFTTGTQPELAQQFARYWFNEGYTLWLGVEPARSAPMRLGDGADAQKFLDLWYDLPISADGQTLTDIFGAEVTGSLSQGIASAPRWGIDSGQGELIATVYEQKVIAIVLQEMLSGYFTSQQAIIATWERVIELVPSYRFDSATPVFATLEPEDG